MRLSRLTETIVALARNLYCVSRRSSSMASVTVILILLYLWLSLQSAEVTEKIRVETYHRLYGWLTSRSMKDYIRPDQRTTLIEPRSPSGIRAFLVNIVISSPRNVEKRKILRETWARNTDEVRSFFLTGVDKTDNTSHLLAAEAEQYGDIIQEDFEEDYRNLTIKSMFMLKWLLAHCVECKYVLKVDDDMYVDTAPLLKQLHSCWVQDGPCDQSPNFVAGLLYKNVKPDRDPNSKWYLPPEFYKLPALPDFVSGTAYLLGGRTYERLYNQGLQTPFINLEDVYLTGIVARSADIQPVSMPGFEKTRPLWTHPCICRGHLTIHGLDAYTIQTLYDNQDKSCSFLWSIFKNLMIWVT